jgi:hypothetical protein
LKDNEAVTHERLCICDGAVRHDVIAREIIVYDDANIIEVCAWIVAPRTTLEF